MLFFFCLWLSIGASLKAEKPGRPSAQFYNDCYAVFTGEILHNEKTHEHYSTMKVKVHKAYKGSKAGQTVTLYYPSKVYDDVERYAIENSQHQPVPFWVEKYNNKFYIANWTWIGGQNRWFEELAEAMTNKRNGCVQIYYQQHGYTDVLQAEGCLKDGMATGEWRYYGSTEKLRYLAHYNKGLKNETWKEYKSPTTVWHWTYKNGSLKKLSFYENEQLVSERFTSWTCEAKNPLCAEYWDNALEWNFQNRKATIKKYDKDQKVIEFYEVERVKHNLIYRELDKNGKIKNEKIHQINKTGLKSGGGADCPSRPQRIAPDGCTAFQSIVSSNSHFRIHYITDCSNFPADCVNASDITTIGNALETAYYTLINDPINAYFYMPPPQDGECGGDEKHDVYIKDVGGTFFPSGVTKADGDASISPNYSKSAYSFIELNPGSTNTAYFGDWGGTVATHEFFHMIHNGYISNSTVFTMPVLTNRTKFLTEGTATWAEKSVLPTNTDFYSYIDETFIKTYKNFLLNETGDDKPYGGVFFWRYLTDRFSKNIIKEIWEANAKGECPCEGLPGCNCFTNTAGNCDCDDAIHACEFDDCEFDEFKAIDNVLISYGSSYRQAYQDFLVANMLLTNNTTLYSYYQAHPTFSKYTYKDGVAYYNNNAIVQYHFDELEINGVPFTICDTSFPNEACKLGPVSVNYHKLKVCGTATEFKITLKQAGSTTDAIIDQDDLAMLLVKRNTTTNEITVNYNGYWDLVDKAILIDDPVGNYNQFDLIVYRFKYQESTSLTFSPYQIDFDGTSTAKCSKIDNGSTPVDPPGGGGDRKWETNNTPQEASTFSLYTLTGQVIIVNKTIDNPQYRNSIIRDSHLPTGMYIAVWRDQQARIIETRKIVVTQ